MPSEFTVYDAPCEDYVNLKYGSDAGYPNGGNPYFMKMVDLVIRPSQPSIPS